MVEQLVAYCILGWLCPVGPVLFIWIGVQIGRYGFRKFLTQTLYKIAGPEGPDV